MNDQFNPDTTPLDYEQLYTSVNVLALLESGNAIAGRTIGELVERSFQSGLITANQQQALKSRLLGVQLALRGKIC